MAVSARHFTDTDLVDILVSIEIEYPRLEKLISLQSPLTQLPWELKHC